MVPVEADLFEVGWLYVRQPPALHQISQLRRRCVSDNVPGFRYEGLLTAPRKDAYYNTFIKNFFLSKDRRTAAANLTFIRKPDLSFALWRLKFKA